ncbi:SPFH domain-containing protein [Sinimarinibacterium flocculans]|uniref:SPFH domain-containing protein n=1 Tax=Sinimarinibacterium flocculans TaxID=985250 RepID=UPI003511771B
MLGFKYLKASPSTYVLQFRRGRAVREGVGLSFFYFAPNSSIVAIPVSSVDVPFVFKEVSADYQDVTIQGQATYRVADPKQLAGMLDFTLKPDHQTYAKEDPQKLSQRVVNTVQVQVKTILQRLPLQEILRQADELVGAVRQGLQASEGLSIVGVEITDLSILAVRPTPETARALEAKVRETILKEADDAIYVRRNAAIEQERAVKENELRTEIAIEHKKREIRETQMEAERVVLEKRQQMERQQMQGKVELEQKNTEYVELAAANAKRQSDAKAYGLQATMKAVEGVDAKVLQALTLGSADPATLIALAFQGLADNAEKVGELNISPDLLRQLMGPRPSATVV